MGGKQIKSKAKTMQQLTEEVANFKNEMWSQAALQAAQYLGDRVKTIYEIELLKVQVEAVKNIIISLEQLQRGIAKRRNEWIGTGGISKVIGGAYVDAYNGFKTTQENQAAWDTFMSQMLFSVLAVASTGSLGLLFNSRISTGSSVMARRGGQVIRLWKTSAINNLVSPGLQDVLKELTDKTVEGLGALPAPKEFPDSVAIPEPLQFQHTLEAKMDEQFKSKEEFIDALLDLLKKTKASSFKPGFDKTFDSIISWYLSVMDLPFLKPPKNLNRQVIAKELEIGLWAAWLVNKLEPLINDAKSGRVDRLMISSNSFSFGSEIQDRLRTLGIFSLAGVVEMKDLLDIPTGVGVDQYEKLIKWGNNWKPAHTWG